ncbi:hypothetical protein CW702_01605 [Candidatus Bathyarchaeota archaeon]|nr:MAG: hypothetical protein CW702_01605 [Candidatus Bathyarchaeota archaeon]
MTGEDDTKLSKIEKEAYIYIKKLGEVMTMNLPYRLRGAIPNLKNKGLVEVYKKYTSPWSSRKIKFVRVKSG